MSDDALAARMGEIARTLLGEPNPRHSSGTDLRYGTNGSLSIDPDAGVWFDHESAEGGGVLDLLARQGLQNGSALDWLRDRGFLPPRDVERGPRPAPGPRVAVATYDYIDEHGEVVFQVVRYEPKTFRQRRRARPGDDPKDIRDGWVWSVKGIALVPYRLPELLEDLAADRAVMIVEGEKDVDALRLRGIPATCNPMGAGKWSADLDRHFRGADVIILPDNDEPGRKHRDLVAGRLAGIASRVRSLDLPGLSPKGDAADWLDAGGSAEELYHLVETRARAPGDAPPASRFGALWLDAIPGTGNIAPWIVKGIVPGGGFGAIVGQPGCGKSFLALDLAFTTSVLAIAEGEDARWFGRRVRPVGVAYIAAEGQGGFHKRVEALIKRFKVADLGRYPFVLYPTALDLRSDTDVGPLGEELKAISVRMRARMGVPLGLVIVDTLNRVLAGGDENAPEDMGAFIRNCGRLQEATGGATVVPVHHMNAAGTRERGHSSLRGALDFMIEVERGETGNVWKVAKQKDDSDGLSFPFGLVSQLLGLDEDGDAITSCLVQATDASGIGASPDKGKKLPPQALTAYQILFRYCDDHGQRRFVDGRDRPCVTLQAWQDECRRQNLVAPGSGDDAFRKAFQRALDAIRAANRIRVEGDIVFPVVRKFDSS